MFTCLCSYFYIYVFMCENKDDDDDDEVQDPHSITTVIERHSAVLSTS